MAQGFQEVLDEDYLCYRIRSAEYVGEKLLAAGIANHRAARRARHLHRCRAHSVPHIPPSQFPGQALVVALYRHAGIRAVEIGSVMFGGGGHAAPALELVRLAFPRRLHAVAHGLRGGSDDRGVPRSRQIARFADSLGASRAASLYGAFRGALRRPQSSHEKSACTACRTKLATHRTTRRPAGLKCKRMTCAEEHFQHNRWGKCAEIENLADREWRDGVLSCGELLACP